MQGKIKAYNENRGFGFISGEDGNDYFFHISSVSGTEPLRRGTSVSFTAMRGEKNRATDVKIQSQGQGHNVFIAFGDVRIKLSNIKSYGIGCHPYHQCFIKVYEKNPKYTHGNFLKKLVTNPYCWKGKRQRVHFNNAMDYVRLATDSTFLYQVCASIGGKLEPVGEKYITKEEALMEGFLNKPEDYLYVTTYQNDNYRFYETEVPFDIREKCSEIDQHML